ncbi:MAG TPA: disulfide bond formation protein B [Chromatiales bacterium]|nr:disulfide bond formation protein B [Chromatiales bacterium]
MSLFRNPRQSNLIGFLTCVGLMAYALFAQYGLKLEPCPLCVFQRVAVIVLGLIFLIAALHNPGPTGRRVYGGLEALAAAGGAGVAARHVWLQNLPPDQVPACGPGLDFMMDTFGIGKVIRMVLSGSGECADISWSFLGLSMPAWVLIACTVLGFYALWVNWRQAD